MAIKAETSFSLKDDLFNKETVTELADGLKRAHSRFSHRRFVDDSLAAFGRLELKERIEHLVTMVAEHLPSDFDRARRILLEALPPPLDPTLTDDDFGRFIWVVPGEFVARHGCDDDRLEASLAFLKESTKRFSAENAIRPFLLAYPEATMAFVRECAGDENYHVRRLASEGIRPLLPWAPRVRLPDEDILEVLDMLHGDATRYVTRSVANTLNDIAKSDADAVIASLRKWQKANRQQPAELEWMTRHALRTLIKADHPKALSLLGYPTKPDVKIARFTVSKQVKVGESLDVTFDVTSNRRQRLLIAMKIHYRKANGSLAPKVFKVKDLAAGKGEKFSLSKSQPFRPMTTRVLYPGQHKVEIVINGNVLAQKTFELLA